MQRALAPLLVLPFLLLGFAACIDLADTASEQELLGGGQPEAGYPATGYLASGYSRDGLLPSCTATLIAPKVALTAAHCIQQKTYLVYGFGTGPQSAVSINVASRVYLPSSLVSTAPPSQAHDVAILILENAESIPPASVDSIANAVTGNGYLPARAIGRGLPSYTKMSGPVQISDHDSQFIYVTSDSTSLCLGDSGGPLMIDGTNRMVGSLFGASGGTDCSNADVGLYVSLAGESAFVSDGIACGGGDTSACNRLGEPHRAVSDLVQTIWRGNQSYMRWVTVKENRLIAWNESTDWVPSLNGNDIPGLGAIQTWSDFVLGDMLVQGFWRNDQGWSRTVPYRDGRVVWEEARPWHGPYPGSDIPGSGALQAQSGFVIHDKFWQGIWRGNQGWSRWVPIDNVKIRWDLASRWSGPISLSSMPGSGEIQAQDDLVQSSTLTQGFWRGNQGWSRTVPIRGGMPIWAEASRWYGPILPESVPGTGTFQSQSGYFE